MTSRKAINGPHQGKPVLTACSPLTDAHATLVMIHGRGSTANNILELARVISNPHLACIAPQADNNVWYPHSFLAPLVKNEPALSSAFQALEDAIAMSTLAGISQQKIILGGFSQGACIVSEFVARQGKRFGGLLVFSGGLIGPPGTPRAYPDGLDGLPVLIGCSNVDPHVPINRVNETSHILTQLGASVDKQIYPNMGHTINDDELDRARKIVGAVTEDA